MPHDKQLRGVTLGEVLRRRQLDQALNAKQFAVLAGISYSTAREWFRLPGFPAIRGALFWSDFVRWRHAQTGASVSRDETGRRRPFNGCDAHLANEVKFPQRAAELLAEAG